jgi:hypothetical protein
MVTVRELAALTLPIAATLKLKRHTLRIKALSNFKELLRRSGIDKP